MAIRKWAIISMISLAGGFAHAQDLGVIDPGQPILLPLENASGSLFVEIDGIDVTDFSIVENGVLWIQPLTPFERGTYDIIVYAADSFEILATASFEAGGARSLTWQFDAVHELEARSVNGTGSETAQSSGTLRAETDDQSFTANIGYYATSVTAQQINGNDIDVTEYLFSFDQYYGNIGLRANLGHHTVSYDDVLVADLTKRGLSSEFSGLDGQIQIGLFGMRVDDALGVDNFTGLSDQDDRIQGAQVKVQPIAGSSFAIGLQGYEGEGAPFGALDPGVGEGLSLSFSGASGDGRFRYGATAAETTWDEDGDGAVFSPVTAEAYQGFVSYDLPEQGLTSVTLGVEAARVDQYFFSLANEGMITGVERYRVTADILRDRLSLGLAAQTEETNVNGDPNDPTDRINSVEISGVYDGLGQGALSDASLSVFATYTEQERLITPLGAPDPADYRVFDIGVNLDSFGDVWGWGLGYRYVLDDDLTPTNLDVTNHEVTGYVTFSPTTRFDLSANAWLVYSEDIFENWTDSEVDLTVNYALIEDVLDLSTTAGLFATDAPGGQDGEYIEGALEWSFVPSADLILSGRLARNYYATESGTDEDRVISLFLRANTNFLK